MINVQQISQVYKPGAGSVLANLLSVHAQRVAAVGPIQQRHDEVQDIVLDARSRLSKLTYLTPLEAVAEWRQRQDAASLILPLCEVELERVRRNAEQAALDVQNLIAQVQSLKVQRAELLDDSLPSQLSPSARKAEAAKHEAQLKEWLGHADLGPVTQDDKAAALSCAVMSRTVRSW